MTSRPEIVPVILAGGQGKRLWPLTSPKRPKPFLSLNSGLSFFQRTVLRVRSFAPPIIVCHHSYRGLVKDHLARVKVEPRAIILEPDHRNTAAAIAMAAFFLKGQGSLMLVLPSDHSMKNIRSFEKAVVESIAYTIENMVLLGVTPTAAETDYGYIMLEPGETACRPVKQFVEKPDEKKAEMLLSLGNCLWNTGMFLSRPSVFLQQLERASPGIFEMAQLAHEGRAEKGHFIQPDKKFFSEIEPLSVDYAVMEKATSYFARELNVPWSDVGTLRRLWRWRFKDQGPE